MARPRVHHPAPSPFDRVVTIGLTLPGVQTRIRYDGATLLTVGGAFMAGLATEPSAEPGTLVVRCDVEDRRWLLEDAPETYYLTAFYERYPLVLARLSSLDDGALRDLLAVSRRLTLPKAGARSRAPARSRPARRARSRATAST